MAKVELEIEDMLNETVLEYVKELCKRAYEQGIEDGQSRYKFPYVLKKEDLAEIFQVEMPTVTKIVAHPTFPRFKEVRARYPRDQVFMWINNHSYFIDEIMHPKKIAK